MHSIFSRFLYYITSLFFWCGLSLTFLLMFFMACAFILVSVLQYNSDRIEEVITSNIFFEKANIGNIDIKWEGISPVIYAQDIEIQSQLFTIELSDFSVAPKIIDSIRQLRPVFGAFVTKNAKVDFFITESDERTTINIDTIAKILFICGTSGNVFITDSSLTIHYGGSTTTIDVNYLRNNYAKKWWLEAKLGIDSISQDIHVKLANHQGLPNSLQDADFTLQIALKEAKMPQNLGLPERYHHISIKDLVANFHYANQNIKNITMHASDMLLNNAIDDSFQFSVIIWPDEQALVNKDKLSINDYKVWIPSIENKNGKIIENLYLKAYKNNIDQQDIYLYVSRLQLAEMNNVLSGLKFLPNQLTLKGIAEKLSLVVPLSDPKRLSGTVKITNAEIYERKNNLQISDWHGQIVIDEGKIYTHLDTPLRLGIYSIYQQPWYFNNVSGDLEINLNNNDIIKIYISNTKAITNEFEADIEIQIAIPNKNTVFEQPIFAFQANFLPMPIEYKDDFIPYLLLGEDIENTVRPMLVGGNMHGEIQLELYNDDRGIIYNLHVDFENTNVHYLSNRPVLTQTNGTLDLDQNQLKVNGFGNIHEKRVDINNLTLDFSETRLALEAFTNRNFPDLLLLMRDFLENDDFIMPSWLDLSGDVDMQIILNVPLQTPDQLTYNFTLDLQKSLLVFDQLPDIPITVAGGKIGIADGVLSQITPFTATWKQQQMQASVEDIHFLVDKTIEANIQTELPISLLNTYTGIHKKLFSGTSYGKSYIRFNIEDVFVEAVDVQIDMRESVIHLPDTWKKPSGQNFILDGSFRKRTKADDARIQFILPGYARGDVYFSSLQEPLRGNVGLGFSSLQPLPESHENLEVALSLTSFDTFVWQQWWQELEDISGDIFTILNSEDTSVSPVTENKTIVDNLENIEKVNTPPEKPILVMPPDIRLPKPQNLFANATINFEIGKISYKDYYMSDIDFSIDFDETSSRADIISEQLEATVHMPYQEDLPIKFEFHQLHIPEFLSKITVNKDDKTVDTVDKKDIFEDFAIEYISPIDVVIHQGSYDSSPLGFWNFQIRSNEKGVFIRDIHARYLDSSLQGSVEWLYTDDGVNQLGLRSMQTAVSIQIQGENIEKLAQLVDADQAQLDLYIQWPASPAGFRLSEAKGNIGIDFLDGEIKLDSPTIGLVNFIGLFNIERLGKRLKLDFSDQGSGMAFDKAEGNFSLQDGVVTNVSPFHFSGAVFDFTVTGNIDVIEQTIDQEMILRISIDEALPIGALLLGYTPQTALILFFSNYLLNSPLSSLISGKYSITGTFENPKFTVKQIFGAGFPGKVKQE